MTDATTSPPRVAIVVPCYNEQAALPATAEVLDQLLTSLESSGAAAAGSTLCFVDDGSRDATWQLITELSGGKSSVTGLKLSRNFGHQGAVLAGLLECDADVIITIDADLQQDPQAIADMLQKYGEGFDLVLGVSADRSSDSFGKRVTAECYYRLMRMLGVNIVFNHADYRLMSRRAVEMLREYSETNLFLRGIVTLLGLKSTIVKYERRARTAGSSKYPVRKMLSLAWEGITSFSIVPLRIVSVIGLVISLLSLAVTVYALYVRLVRGDFVPGWASTVVPMYFLGGIQILCLGVIGEYIGKLYLEAKRRPRYLVETVLGSKSREPGAGRISPERPKPLQA